MSQVHTMATYTRCSDSILCVPLLIDAACLAVFFQRHNHPFPNVARAMSYLFKVNEGLAEGVDPGFFEQMLALKREVALAVAPRSRAPSFAHSPDGAAKDPGVSAPPAFAIAPWLASTPAVLAAGLVCLDLQVRASEARGREGGGGVR
jgi:hypothetical protein